MCVYYYQLLSERNPYLSYLPSGIDPDETKKKSLDGSRDSGHNMLTGTSTDSVNKKIKVLHSFLTVGSLEVSQAYPILGTA